jgi:hypothetical protein
MAVVLTNAELDFLARQASWKFDFNPMDGNDSFVLAGDGVDDLDRLTTRIQGLKRFKLTLDVGRQFDVPKPVTLEDVAALRAAYVAIHGAVDKPQEPFENSPGHATEL